MEVLDTDKASDFGGHSPAHRRRIRPNRGLQNDDHYSDPDQDLAIGSTPSTGDLELLFTISLPFEPRSCEISLQTGSGNYLLLNINNAQQHSKQHNREARIAFTCLKCGKSYQSKLAAQCHVPKFPGPRDNHFESTM